MEQVGADRRPGEACWRSGFRCGGKIFRSRRLTVRACFLPCRRGRGSGCRCRHGCNLSTRSGLWREWSGLRSVRRSGSRCRETSAAVRCRWAAETARRGKRRRKERCRRGCVQRCRDILPSRLRQEPQAERKTLRRFPPGFRCEKRRLIPEPGIRRFRIEVSPSIFGVMVGSSVY